MSQSTRWTAPGFAASEAEGIFWKAAACDFGFTYVAEADPATESVQPPAVDADRAL